MLVDPQGNVFTIANTAAAGEGQTSRVTDGTWKNRINNWLGDSVPKYRQPITQKNLQEMRSYMAQANGGLFGVFPAIPVKLPGFLWRFQIISLPL